MLAGKRREKGPAETVGLARNEGSGTDVNSGLAIFTCLVGTDEG
jgi:hypothetical protein